MERCLALCAEAPRGLLSSYGAASPLRLVRHSNKFYLAHFFLSPFQNILGRDGIKVTVLCCLSSEGNSCYLSRTSLRDCLFSFSGSLANQCCSRLENSRISATVCLFVCACVSRRTVSFAFRIWIRVIFTWERWKKRQMGLWEMEKHGERV